MLRVPGALAFVRAWAEWLRWPLLWLAVVPPVLMVEHALTVAAWPTRIGR